MICLFEAWSRKALFDGPLALGRSASWRLEHVALLKPTIIAGPWIKIGLAYVTILITRIQRA